jgi:hypothetical protein
MKYFIVRALLRLYPSQWRREYGGELTEILHARPFTAATLANVLRNGLWQRLRATEISGLVGIGMLLVMFTAFVWNIVAPAPYYSESTLLLQNFWRSNLFIEILVGCGFRTYLRHHDISRSGKAAVKIALLAGIPAMLAGILMLSGFIGVIVAGRWDIPTTFREHGFAYTYYNEPMSSCWIRVQQATGSFKAIESATCPPAPLGILLAPVFTLPASWLWGLVGGLLGRWIVRGRRIVA